jgi:hypothetical protein
MYAPKEIPPEQLRVMSLGVEVIFVSVVIDVYLVVQMILDSVQIGRVSF